MRVVIKKILLLIVTIVLFVFFLEAVSRFVYQDSFETKDNSLYVKSKDIIIGFEMRPDYTSGNRMLKDGKITYLNNSEYIHINSKGLRDYEYEYEKPENTFRIVILGDSVTFARNIKAENTYPKVLERMFVNYSKNIDIEVINMGVESYSILQETRLLDSKGILYDPDLIIFGYVLNDPKAESDFFKNMAGLSYVYKRGIEIDKVINASPVCKIKNKIGRSYFLTNTNLKTMINTFLVRTLYPEYTLHETLAVYNNDCAYKRVDYSFNKILEISNKKNIPVLIVIFPLLEDFSDYKFSNIHDRVSNHAESKGFYTLDIYNEYKEYNFKNLRKSTTADWGFGLLVHPNALGHSIAAEAIYKKITDEKLIK